MSCRVDRCLYRAGLEDTLVLVSIFVFFSSRRRHTSLQGDWSSDVCSSDLSARSTKAPDERAVALTGGASPQEKLQIEALRNWGTLPSLPPCLPALCPSGGKIGRASCRERV